jgi:hypothetical protein
MEIGESTGAENISLGLDFVLPPINCSRDQSGRSECHIEAVSKRYRSAGFAVVLFSHSTMIPASHFSGEFSRHGQEIPRSRSEERESHPALFRRPRHERHRPLAGAEGF